MEFVIADALMSMGNSIGGGCAIAGMGGAATGVGVVFGSFIEAYSRNPEMGDELFRYAILGFALTEAMGLMSMMMSLIILG